MDFSLSHYDAIIRLTLSFILGGIIGWEREKTNRPAGFRTHILVTMSSCLAMIINFEILETFGGMTNVDPGRMGSYVISGIGFLGAGTIIREGASVKGLTTAAGLWASACIGLAIGAGLYDISIYTTLLTLFTLLVMNKVEHKVRNKREKSFQEPLEDYRELAQQIIYQDIINEVKNEAKEKDDNKSQQ